MSIPKRTKILADAEIAGTSNPTPPSRLAETIANNDDLLIEILLRVPISSLLKFKSVSKHWLSVISNPKFSLRRNSITVPVSGLFFPRSLRSINEISKYDFVNLVDRPYSHVKAPLRSLPFADDPSNTEIIQSCRGLLLCFTYFPRGLDRKNDYAVYNPTTKQYTKLPPISQIDDGTKICGLSLAFDPSNSPHYKVVCVRNGKDSMYQIQIYSSETRRWRFSGGSFDFESFDIEFHGGVYCNGCLHWISVWEDSAFFNVEEERFSLLPMPPPPEDFWNHDHKHRYFGESRGHLHLIDTICDQTSRFDVLEMEMDYSGWFVKFRVDLSDIPMAFPEIVRREFDDKIKRHMYMFSLLCIVRSEFDEDSYLLLQIPGKVIRYNFKNRTFFELCDYETDSTIPENAWPPAHQYFESLALV
ncbi:hypothetical protein TIFTF001_010273 [Ficus carica]|uniref:F-box domain-containing protein n=1 Tax=Ficus carica TaxID=3494 RepID=A0AA87ZWR3_FICCA|nr:hypothetical protein TIFTF001_010273 [Ficus carica]